MTECMYVRIICIQVGKERSLERIVFLEEKNELSIFVWNLIAKKRHAQGTTHIHIH